MEVYVASPAKRDTVIDDVAQVMVLGEGLDMMCMHPDRCAVPALAAGVIVSLLDGSGPREIFARNPRYSTTTFPVPVLSAGEFWIGAPASGGCSIFNMFWRLFPASHRRPLNTCLEFRDAAIILARPVARCPGVTLGESAVATIVWPLWSNQASGLSASTFTQHHDADYI